MTNETSTDAGIQAEIDLLDAEIQALTDRRDSLSATLRQRATEAADDAIRQIVADLRATGMTKAEIAAATGLRGNVLQTRPERRSGRRPGRRPGAKPIDRGRIIEAWNQGLTTEEIADELGAAVTTIRKLVRDLRKQGHDLPRRTPGPRAMPYDAIASMWREGKSEAEIASEVGCGPRVLSAAVIRMRKQGYDLERQPSK